MAKLTTKELEKLIPSKIKGHGHNGNFTLIKRSDNKFMSYYPFESTRTINTTKGKTINATLQKMHDQLVEKNIIHSQVVKKKKKKSKNKKERKPLEKKTRLNLKLKAQERALKNK